MDDNVYERGEIIYFCHEPGNFNEPIWIGVVSKPTSENGVTRVWWAQEGKKHAWTNETLSVIKIARLGKIVNMEAKKPQLAIWNGFGYASR